VARLNVFLLHGFLGRPEDWKPVEDYLAQENLRFFVPDYFRIPRLSPLQNFEQWAKNFNSWAEAQTQGQGKNILVGYSLGGRLALHALADNPALWNKAVFISTNPGFNDPHHSFDNLSEERKKRWLSDSKWAANFMNSPWESVIQAWNAQPIFSGGENEPQRAEKEYSRDTLSLALTQWSLAQQKNMREVLKQNCEKISWLVGEDDEKFADAAQLLKIEIPELHVQLLNAAHRIPYEAPQILAMFLRNLLR